MQEITPKQQRASEPHVHGPAWRWARAQAIGHRRLRHAETTDPLLVRVVHFWRLQSKCPQRSAVRRLQRLYPDLLEALAVYEAKGVQRHLIEALILADTPVDEIAATTNLPPEVVQAYEATFYDLRSLSHSPGFVAITVADAQLLDPANAGDALWKMVAHEGGAAALAAFRNQDQPLAAEQKELFARMTRGLIRQGAVETILATPPETLNRHVRRQLKRYAREEQHVDPDPPTNVGNSPPPGCS